MQFCHGIMRGVLRSALVVILMTCQQDFFCVSTTMAPTPSPLSHTVYLPIRNHANCGSLKIPFPSPVLASQALQILSPDKELREDQVKRTLSIDGTDLRVKFECVSARMARVSVNAFLENLDLVVSSMSELGELM